MQSIASNKDQGKDKINPNQKDTKKNAKAAG
jgi:hypothetical protein